MHHHHHSHIQPILNALSTVEGLTSGLSVLVGQLSSTDLIDDTRIATQLNETHRALDRLGCEVRGHIHSQDDHRRPQ